MDDLKERMEHLDKMNEAQAEDEQGSAGNKRGSTFHNQGSRWKDHDT